MSYFLLMVLSVLNLACGLICLDGDEWARTFAAFNFFAAGVCFRSTWDA